MMLLRLDDGPRDHDYTRNSWGHTLHNPHMKEEDEPLPGFWNKLLRRTQRINYLTCCGYGDVREGDTLRIRMESGKIARFIVREIEYFSDPRDMFNLKRADFVEYVE